MLLVELRSLNKVAAQRLNFNFTMDHLIIRIHVCFYIQLSLFIYNFNGFGKIDI